MQPMGNRWHLFNNNIGYIQERKYYIQHEAVDKVTETAERMDFWNIRMHLCNISL